MLADKYMQILQTYNFEKFVKKKKNNNFVRINKMHATNEYVTNITHTDKVISVR